MKIWATFELLAGIRKVLGIVHLLCKNSTVHSIQTHSCALDSLTLSMCQKQVLALFQVVWDLGGVCPKGKFGGIWNDKILVELKALFIMYRCVAASLGKSYLVKSGSSMFILISFIASFC